LAGGRLDGAGDYDDCCRIANRPPFLDPQIDHLRIVHDVTNLPSAGVPRRLGYTLLGDREATGMRSPDDVGIDCLWELRRADWPGYASLA